MKIETLGLGFLSLVLVACGEDSISQVEDGRGISSDALVVESSSSYDVKDSLYSSYVENLSSENYFSSSSFENDSLNQDSVENEEKVCDESNKGVVVKRVVSDSVAYFICRYDAYKYKWVETTSLNYEFYRTECVMDGTLKLFGNGTYYVCDSVRYHFCKRVQTFRKATEMEILLGKGCNENLVGEEYESFRSIYSWTCSADSMRNDCGPRSYYWKINQTFALSNCNKDGKLFEAIYDDSAHTKAFVCDADSFRVISDSLEKVLQKGCTSWNEGALAKSGSNYICKDGKWRFDSERILFDSISYGGRWYRTVTIGNQVWFAENMSFETKGDSCFRDSCDIYGRLYSMSAAMSVCPEGWHLPNNYEWKTLVEFVKARKPNNESITENLKSKNYFDSRYPGLDSFGFSANVSSFF